MDAPVTTAVGVNNVVGETVAMVKLLLLQVPPIEAMLNVVVCPWHTVPAPVMVAGGATMVIDCVTKHDVGRVNVITALPGDTPFTTPVFTFTVATVVEVALQVPRGVASLMVTEELTHKYFGEEVMAAGSGLTVTEFV